MRMGLTGGRALLIVSTVVLLAALGGCYDKTSNSPVDRLHYAHSILVWKDYSHVRIITYVARNHLEVGLIREDLHDGDGDGALTTPGMDRVAIAEYQKVDDPLESADRREGALADYDALFKQILAAAKAKKHEFKIEDRTYSLQFFSEELSAAPARGN